MVRASNAPKTPPKRPPTGPGASCSLPPAEPFSWIEADWVIPDVDAPTENQWYYCASWIGIDGDGSRDVCQIGIECEVYRSGNSITRNIYPWWEWFPESEVAITNFSAQPGRHGDRLAVHVRRGRH